MPDSLIQKLVEQYIRDRLKELDQDRYIPTDEYPPFFPFESLVQIQENAEAGERSNNKRRVDFYNRDFSASERLANDLIDSTGATSIEKGSQAYTELCAKILEADIKLWPLFKKSWLMDFSFKEDISKVFPEIVQGNNEQGRYSDDVEVVVPMPNAPDTIKLMDLWEDYKSSKVKSGRWRKGVVRNHQPKSNALCQFVGNVPINRITKDKIREYRKLLDNLPPYFARKKEYKDLSRVTPDGIKGKHNETLDVTTIREYMNLARALFTFAVDNDYITVNPVLSGMIPPKKGNARKQRYPFSDPEDLERIFNPNLFFDWTKDRPERFWVPLLSLYTGARLEELCQLEVADVSEYDGIWCIHVRGETSDLDDPDDQKGRVKHETNPRILPLHPFLVDHLRFPEYVKQVQARGQKRIFHDLNKNKSTNWKYGHGPSKHFGYYLRKKVRISDKKKTFHSFRHNAADHLYDKLVLESVIEELEGRAGKTQTRKRYTTGYRVPVLYEEAILKLDYKVDLTHLKNSKYVVK